MNVKQVFNKIVITTALFLLVFSIGCTGAGIFAVVAVSEKIDLGLLPEGISGRPVVHIAPVPADGTEDYYFFSSGPGIWVKDHTAGDTDLARLWWPISLDGWDGVQAMAANDERIFLALYKVSGDNYTVAIRTLDSFTAGSPPVYTDIAGAEWVMDPNAGGYNTIRLFAPDPSGPVYVNVMSHSGVYASLDEENQGFTGSILYTLPGNATTWGEASALPNQSYLDGNNGIASARYITGIADRVPGAVVADDIRITATNHMFNSNGGILLDGDGAAVTNLDGNPAGSISIEPGVSTNVSARAITWLDRTGIGDGAGVFIMAATFLDNDTLPIFVSGDGITWNRISGTTTDYLTTSFINVSDKTAGLSDGKHLILAGTSSYIDGSTSHYGSGYNEIDITNNDLSAWTVNTAWDSYSFALNTNYSVSDLAEATITGMSIPEGGDDLYVSTRSEGVWKINMEDPATDKPSWTRE